MDPCRELATDVMCSLDKLAGFLKSNDTPISTTPRTDRDKKIISDNLLFALEILFYVIGCGVFSMAGIVANIINAVVFYRQGLLTDSSNVSLFGLAVSDLCCLITLLWMAIATSIVLSEPKGWNWVPKDVMLLTGALPHVIFAQATCWITAYISFERCMCVVFPFKMKTLFTAKRSAIIVPVFIVYNFASYTPLFMTQSLRWMNDPKTNMTKLVAYNNELYDSMQALDNYLNSFANRLLPIGIVLVCTSITSIKVKASQRFRENVAGVSSGRTGDKNALDKNNKSKTSAEKSSSSSSSSSQKEDKLVRMIVFISLIFLVCYSSDIVMVIFKYLLPEIQHNGTYHNLFHLTLSLQFFLESINSSINIIVYYNLSSRFKVEFKKLFSAEE